jgi:hypothetical protein
MEELIREFGHRTLKLRVRAGSETPTNDDLKAFYRSLGFVERGRPNRMIRLPSVVMGDEDDRRNA